VYKGGIAAVYAEELTRESIWDALWKRRCYGTTGVKLFLDFKINGRTMGEEIRTRDGKLQIEVEASGAGKIKQIDIVKDNKDLYSRRPDKEVSRFSKAVTVEGDSFFYVRVTQNDRNMAWSSPIWVRFLG